MELEEEAVCACAKLPETTEPGNEGMSIVGGAKPGGGASHFTRTLRYPESKVRPNNHERGIA